MTECSECGKDELGYYYPQEQPLCEGCYRTYNKERGIEPIRARSKIPTEYDAHRAAANRARVIDNWVNGR